MNFVKLKLKWIICICVILIISAYIYFHERLHRFTLCTPRWGSYSVTMVDGTLANINESTCLDFEGISRGPERKVLLEGESYFDVKEYDNKPFIISCNNQLLTTKKGRFNVKGYVGEPITATVLADTLTATCNEGRTEKVAPGQQIVITPTGCSVTNIVDTATYVSWRKNSFAFKDVYLMDALKLMNRWYGIKISEGLPMVKVSGTFDRNRPFAEVIKAFDKDFHVQLNVKDSIVSAYKKS